MDILADGVLDIIFYDISLIRLNCTDFSAIFNKNCTNLYTNYSKTLSASFLIS